jgi:hypothetical protein
MMSVLFCSEDVAGMLLQKIIEFHHNTGSQNAILLTHTFLNFFCVNMLKSTLSLFETW